MSSCCLCFVFTCFDLLLSLLFHARSHGKTHIFKKTLICHSHISHNKPCLPPPPPQKKKMLHNNFLQSTQYWDACNAQETSTETKVMQNLAGGGGGWVANKVSYKSCANGEFQIILSTNCFTICLPRAIACIS